MGVKWHSLFFVRATQRANATSNASAIDRQRAPKPSNKEQRPMSKCVALCRRTSTSIGAVYLYVASEDQRYSIVPSSCGLPLAIFWVVA